MKKEFKKEDPSTWPYPCICYIWDEEEELKDLAVVLSRRDEEYEFEEATGWYANASFYSELPPEGWTAKKEFPRQMLVWFDESYKVREVFGKTLDHWYYTDPSTPGAVYATKKVKEIDHEREAKLKRLEELKQEVESLENELGI